MNIFKKFIHLEKNIITSLENSKLPFIYFILTSLFVITLRNLLESFSSPMSVISQTNHFHFYLSYIALATSLILLFYLLTKTPILKVAKVILPSFIVVILAPILDIILSLGKGYNISYLIPTIHDKIILRFFTFFGNFSEMGVTPGMRIEIAFVLVLALIYFYLKNSNLIKSIFYMLIVYFFIFCYLASPFLVKGLFNILQLKLESPLIPLNNLFLLIIFLTTILLFYFHDKKYFITIVKDIRLFRLLHYQLMFVLGIVLASHYSQISLSINFFNLIFIFISILFAWLFSVVTNNLYDYEIDKISNTKRPLIASQISFTKYKNLTYIFLFIALFYALLVNYTTFFIILLFIGNYFLYSIPPLRLKRVPIFSKLFISLNSLILVMLGFMISGQSLENFPKSLFIVFLIGFTLVINFIDIKDYLGDKKMGIKTLPTLLGLKRSKFIIGLFFVLAYSLVYFVLKDIYLILPLLFFSILQFFLINRKNYSERPVFLIYLFNLLLFLIYYLF